MLNIGEFGGRYEKNGKKITFEQNIHWGFPDGLVVKNLPAIQEI